MEENEKVYRSSGKMVGGEKNVRDEVHSKFLTDVGFFGPEYYKTQDNFFLGEEYDQLIKRGKFRRIILHVY